MSNGNDELLKKARDMDQDVEYEKTSRQEQGQGKSKFNDRNAAGPAGLGGGDTRGR
ncbi:hypothetical protein [Peribacillus saganii]|uniref:hypothetical protein n=1 Tax=Peribacillus saganii TaxID=2303992 RepID=UPI00131458AC|nr:hypothetical protein [Peribacillus saganii]